MAEISVTILNEGLQINAESGAPQENIQVEIIGSGPPGKQGEQGLPGKSPQIRNGFWWTYNTETNQWESTGISVSGGYEIGDGLKLNEETNTLSADTATNVEEDNTKPITSAAVYQTVGNIEILLGTI